MKVCPFPPSPSFSFPPLTLRFLSSDHPHPMIVGFRKYIKFEGFVIFSFSFLFFFFLSFPSFAFCFS